MGFFEDLSNKAGINAIVVILALLVGLAAVFTGYFEQHITMCVGVLLPAHFSMKALASEGKDDDKQWLTYWTIFGLFILVELFFGYVLTVIPFYFLVKITFLIWLFLFNGATFVYDNIISKLFKSVEKNIDDAVDSTIKKVKKIA